MITEIEDFIADLMFNQVVDSYNYWLYKARTEYIFALLNPEE